MKRPLLLSLAAVFLLLLAGAAWPGVSILSAQDRAADAFERTNQEDQKRFLKVVDVTERHFVKQQRRVLDSLPQVRERLGKAEEFMAAMRKSSLDRDMQALRDAAQQLEINELRIRLRLTELVMDEGELLGREAKDAVRAVREGIRRQGRVHAMKIELRTDEIQDLWKRFRALEAARKKKR